MAAETDANLGILVEGCKDFWLYYQSLGWAGFFSAYARVCAIKSPSKVPSCSLDHLGQCKVPVYFGAVKWYSMMYCKPLCISSAKFRPLLEGREG